MPPKMTLAILPEMLSILSTDEVPLMRTVSFLLSVECSFSPYFSGTREKGRGKQGVSAGVSNLFCQGK